MIYEHPKFSPGGDRYMLIEFGDEMNLDLNFMGQGLATALAGGTIPGVVETAPCFATTLIHYEPEIIGYDDLKREVERLIGSPDLAVEKVLGRPWPYGWREQVRLLD